MSNENFYYIPQILVSYLIKYFEKIVRWVVGDGLRTDCSIATNE